MTQSQTVTGIFKEIELRESKLGNRYFRITLKLDDDNPSLFQIWHHEWDHDPVSILIWLFG